MGESLPDMSGCYFTFLPDEVPADLWPKDKPGRPSAPPGRCWVPASVVVREKKGPGGATLWRDMKFIGHVLADGEVGCTTPDDEGD